MTGRTLGLGILRWAAIVVGSAAVLLYVLLPVGMGVAAVFPHRRRAASPPEGFESVALRTGDGVELGAWYRAGPSGATVILLHGAGGSREGVLPWVGPLVARGYGVLLLDLRGHGSSGGATNRLGWQGTQDVRAAVQYLRARGDVRSIGALGLSMGAEVLLGAASELPELRAVVADGATRRSLEEMLALPSARPLARNFTARLMLATVRLLGGSEPPVPLLDSMVRARGTSFLLIAAGADAREVAYNTLFHEATAGRSSLWVAPGASHTGAFRRFPEEYAERVLAFLDGILLPDPAADGR